MTDPTGRAVGLMLTRGLETAEDARGATAIASHMFWAAWKEFGPQPLETFRSTVDELIRSISAAGLELPEEAIRLRDAIEILTAETKDGPPWWRPESGDMNTLVLCEDCGNAHPDIPCTPAVAAFGRSIGALSFKLNFEDDQKL